MDFSGGRPTLRFGSSSDLLLGLFLGGCLTWLAGFLLTRVALAAGLGCGVVLGIGALTGVGLGVGLATL